MNAIERRPAALQVVFIIICILYASARHGMGDRVMYTLTPGDCEFYKQDVLTLSIRIRVSSSRSRQEDYKAGCAVIDQQSKTT